MLILERYPSITLRGLILSRRCNSFYHGRILLRTRRLEFRQRIGHESHADIRLKISNATLTGNSESRKKLVQELVQMGAAPQQITPSCSGTQARGHAMEEEEDEVLSDTFEIAPWEHSYTHMYP
ncbi:hypothetical protein ACRE_083850 [Hapsidospora chrysogenum ATCC 11550]|uniref:Uncharacterized protein n=1 Tax=Hapsidospora chrysogenum (strain ATCC 11550 / CBS 779.69 / DSM 880 / IAM 14645 / JCM 23072 / IMI 49137) TaxID=857340 RepID=A0A086SUY0_HAPC1|nr:hypothetical protein ACRE_083850 [Hapsidospora chrysogenum ATCC 11550]